MTVLPPAERVGPEIRTEFATGLLERGRALAAAGPAWLGALRRDAAARFAARGLPEPGDEAWRGTSLAALGELRFAPPPTLRAAEAERTAFADLELDAAADLVFVDGQLDARRSSVDGLPAGVYVGSLARLLADRPQLLQPWLEAGMTAQPSTFADLNTALFEDGLAVVLPEGAEILQPIVVTWLRGPGTTPVAVHSRTLIAAGSRSRATVVEVYAGADGAEYLHNAVSDVHVGDAARLSRIAIQNEAHSAFHISTVRMRQGRDSEIVDHAIDFGARLARHDLDARLDGPGGTCNLWGLYLAGDGQHVDHHTALDHAAPHCGSREMYKGILDGDARAVFRGRIVVRPGAQKTDAKQSNRNLLLSARALAHTRPQLEILADDVKCTHGATIGQLDREALFYLRSRGIGGNAARALLVQAFAGEVSRSIEIGALRQAVEREIGARLAAGSAA